MCHHGVKILYTLLEREYTQFESYFISLVIANAIIAIHFIAGGMAKILLLRVISRVGIHSIIYSIFNSG